MANLSQDDARKELMGRVEREIQQEVSRYIEKQLEEAIEFQPKLLFRQQVSMLARQHYIFTDEGQRQFVDMVFLDPKADEIILVDLKRGRLDSAHHDQLGRYLDHARESKFLCTFLEKGTGLRGVLATVEECTFKPKRKDIEVCIVDRAKAIKVLKRLRRQRRA